MSLCAPSRVCALQAAAAVVRQRPRHRPFTLDIDQPVTVKTRTALDSAMDVQPLALLQTDSTNHDGDEQIRRARQVRSLSRSPNPMGPAASFPSFLRT
jgi:hypothetical protein